MDFLLLGPVEAFAEGRRVELGRRQERCLLGLLLLEAGRVVPIDRLAELLWAGDPPAGARHALHTYVGRLRSALGAYGVRLLTRRDGYLADVCADQVDVHRFVATAGRVHEVTDPAQRSAVLAQALALWRGPLLADVADDRLRERIGLGLQELRLSAVEWRAEADLVCGRPERVVADLSGLTAQYPTRERLPALLMTALYRSGRQTDALAVYRDAREFLVAEFGVEPGPQLRLLHEQVLRNDPVLAGPAASSPMPVRPAHLPCDVAGFTGRTRHLQALDGLVDDEPGPRTLVISAIAGTAGVGKTALAVHWAHHVKDRFPDGQLYVNLRGFDPGGAVMDPAEAVRRFLDALAVPPQRIPVDPDAQASLYRSLLADKKMLVLLDNAANSDQVTPLLPGTAGCLVLVTSRNRLSGLVATVGAHPIPLDLLAVDEARDLLARRIGVRRVAAEPDAVDQIITSCARLPLALAIVAANAASQPWLSLTTIAAELHDAHDRLAVLSTGDTIATDIRAVFSWSYHTLTRHAAQLFRLLGLHSGPDITAPAAASLTALPVDQVHTLLAELALANLIAEPVPGRYTLHDLLRAYAVDLAHRNDPDDQRHTAIHRLLDHYLHSAQTAARLLNPVGDPHTLKTPQAGVTPERPASHQEALNWFTAEHAVLLAAVDNAAATGFDTHTWQLAWTLPIFLARQGHWHDWAATARAAVAAAQRQADPAEEARAHRNLAGSDIILDRLDDADTHLSRALDLYNETGDLIGRAHCHGRLGSLWESRGDPARALHHTEQALNLFRAAGHERGQAQALTASGWHHAHLGDHKQALIACQQALALHEELGNRRGQAATWDSLGYIHHHLGESSQAITSFDHAIALYMEVGDRYSEAETLTHLGDAHHATGNADAARTAWQQALTVLDQLEHPDADTVRAKLHDLGPPPHDSPGHR
jgi:DNA-binding SARP family transcriptional activator/tetratricopeptide (TPR) repeat protein